MPSHVLNAILVSVVGRHTEADTSSEERNISLLSTTTARCSHSADVAISTISVFLTRTTYLSSACQRTSRKPSYTRSVFGCFHTLRKRKPVVRHGEQNRRSRDVSAMRSAREPRLSVPRCSVPRTAATTSRCASTTTRDLSLTER